jgi:hypothetical protein
VAPAKLVELRARLVLADDADDLLLGETAGSVRGRGGISVPVRVYGEVVIGSAV